MILSLQEDDPLYAHKLTVWLRESSAPAIMLRVCATENDDFRRLLALLRFVVATTDEIDSIFAPPGVKYYRTIAREAKFPISVPNERRAMMHLKQLCAAALSYYSQSYDEDVAALNEPGALEQFSNKRNAVIQVCGEKEVLLFFIRMADSVLHLLSLPSIESVDSFVESLAAAPAKQSLKEQYYSAVIHKVCSTQTRFYMLRYLRERAAAATTTSQAVDAVAPLDFSRPTVV